MKTKKRGSMVNQKVVLLVGAGATVADVATYSPKYRPPLDKKFFKTVKKYRSASAVISYMDEIYNLNIVDTVDDSLEKVMARLYTDIFEPTLQDKAPEVFRTLIFLFNKRLADTTNDIVATQRRFLYRIIVYYLNQGFNPENITIVTFNQDLQIEKMLHKIEHTDCWRQSGKIFNFPRCYRLDVSSEFVTTPSESTRNLFARESSSNLRGIQVLKLHGSLNWYSTHRSLNISPIAMFRSDRQLWITRRQSIDPTMKLSGQHRTRHTLPVIVPPVTHKSAILHNRIKRIWGYAEDALIKADNITIFGYSCPALDFESCNLIQRYWKKNRKCRRISIIDPDSNVLKHYVDLINPEKVYYYPSAKYFLKVE